MITIRLKSSSALERYLKMAHWEKIDFSVDVEDTGTKVNFLVKLNTNKQTFEKMVKKYHYSNYEIVE